MLEESSRYACWQSSHQQQNPDFKSRIKNERRFKIAARLLVLSFNNLIALPVFTFTQSNFQKFNNI